MARAAGSLARDLFASDFYFFAQGRGILERPHLTCQMCLREFNTPSKLTEYKNKQGDVSSVLAWDDLTGMNLEAGKVIEPEPRKSGTSETKGCMRTYSGPKHPETDGK